MAPLGGSAWGQRALAAALVIVAIPAILSIAAFWQEAPIRQGEPAPRTVLAPDPIKVDDPETTERERRNAAESIEPITVPDNEARRAIVQSVEDVFASVEQAREPSTGADEEVLSTEEQVAGLVGQLDLPASAIRQLVELNDDELVIARALAVEVAQDLAVRSISEGEVEETVDQIDGILAVRNFPDDIGPSVIKPILADALQPTVRIDEEATAAARDRAAAAVAPVQESFAPGTPIVQIGEVVTEVQMEALRARGLEGADPWLTVIRALALTAATAFSLGFYLRAYRPAVWGSARQLVLLAVLFVLFTLSLQAVVLFVASESDPLMYLLPAGAFAMLTTILFEPPIGVLVTIPITAFVSFAVPSRPGLTAFAALTCLASVPLVSRLSARGALRTAAWRSTLGYGLLAGVFASVFSEPGEIVVAVLAGIGSGVLSAVIVNATLPFLESVFGVLTATSLLDLADRNHPLLRELEQKALGSYNHSVEVSKMVERGARAINADSLLASVAALYHDIGKVQRPYFFVENQFGIDNPHENLEPEVSARIIKEHVTDGIEIARSYRMPAEIVDGIRTHHGTTLVSYFYRQAVNAAGDAPVDEQRFRYDGRKPATREMAILMLADCCEGATRAAALADRNLTREAIADIVTGLIDDRVEDGQLEEASITFRELRSVRASFIESLCYVYHPRITYPQPRARETVGTQQHADGNGAAADEPQRVGRSARGS